MADVKISALPTATTPLAGTEVLPIVQSATTKQVAVSDLTAGRAMSASSLTLTTPLSVANGGTGLTSLTAGYIPYGNGTGAFGSSSGLFWDSANGRLGVGTSTPVTTFQVSGSTGTTFALSDTSASNGSYSNFLFRNTDGTGTPYNVASILGLTTASGGNGALTFYTSSSGSNTERMRIASDGSVGIGTSNPSSFNSSRLALVSSVDYGPGITAVSTSSAANWARIDLKNQNISTVTYWFKDQAGTSGIVNEGAYPLYFGTNNTERARIDSSGNVGIGTSSPGARLQVTDGNYAQLYLLSSTTVGGIRFGNTAYTNGYIYYDEGANLNFHANGSERARIDSSGRLLVGTTSSIAADFNIQSATSGSQGTYLSRHTSTAAGKYWVFGANSSNAYIVYNQDGVGMYMTDGGTSWTGTSDERLKDIRGVISNGVDKVLSLRAVNFTWKSDVENKARVGLVAQDVQKVLPEAVTENAGYLGVAYTDVIPLLTAAIQELAAKVSALEAKQ